MQFSMTGLLRGLCLIMLGGRLSADAQVADFLAHPILSPTQTLAEVQTFTETRVPGMPSVSSVREWERGAERLRQDALDKIVYRGAAAEWRDAKTKVEWLETLEGGPGYRLKKLRFEALPGLWIPALLYEPENLSGKVPVILDVNGHEPTGKSTGYKQIRCINEAKRGMIALNLEWLGMDQLRAPEYHHTRMNLIDLCGTSGLAVFYLNMKRGLDVLLAHEHADTNRVALTGLSGGGWQTIYLASLDRRVKLADPVAGYSSFRTRVRYLEDMGDSEQAPCDMATVLDYTHMTAMLAPRPTLLTYNVKDDCCFAAGHALPPLLQAAEPIFKLYGKPDHLRSHINHDPGTHNYEQENREKFYQMLGDYFYPGDANFTAKEIPSAGEVKAAEKLAIPLPANNATFRTLALDLSKSLPKHPEIPTGKSALNQWQRNQREKLRAVVHTKDYVTQASKIGSEERDGITATFWKLNIGGDWSVPVVELNRAGAKNVMIVLADAGRTNATAEVERLLAAGNRVFAVDPFYFGEARVARRDFLYALLVSTVGERPLGIQASQINAVAAWIKELHPKQTVGVVTKGPRTSLIALTAAATEPKGIDQLELNEPLGSLKEVIEKNWGVNEKPELFCFGLLESFDIPQLEALARPRTITKK